MWGGGGGGGWVGGGGAAVASKTNKNLKQLASTVHRWLEMSQKNSRQMHITENKEPQIFICTTKRVRTGTAVKVLCYKSECLWFDPSWCQWIFG